MPQKWRTHWPLKEGATDAEADRRDSLLHTFGNLTIITGSLNSGLSNQAWSQKRAHIGEHSVLRINGNLLSNEEWDEERIVERGDWIATEVIRLWPGPEAFDPEFDPSATSIPSGERNPENAEMAEETLTQRSTPRIGPLSLPTRRLGTTPRRAQDLQRN